MDVRFSGQTLYCQISRSELGCLAAGRAIDLKVALPRHHAFRMSVRPSAMSADRGGWQIETDPTGIWLTIPRTELELLGQTTTFAERLMREFPVSATETVKVVLEAVADDSPAERSVIEITPQQG